MPGPNVWAAVRKTWSLYRQLVGAEAFSVETDVRQYETEIRALLYSLWSNEIAQAEFERRMRDLLTVFALALIISGLLDAGVPLSGLDQAVADLQGEMDLWISGQAEHISNFARDAAAARENRLSRTDILHRVRLWSRSLEGLANIAGALQRPDEFLTFVGNDGAESCPECQAMRGQRKPASWWVVNNLIPGIPGTESYSCGGWQCQHVLVNDAGVQRLP